MKETQSARQPEKDGETETRREERKLREWEREGKGERELLRERGRETGQKARHIEIHDYDASLELLRCVLNLCQKAY